MSASLPSLSSVTCTSAAVLRRHLHRYHHRPPLFLLHVVATHSSTSCPCPHHHPHPPRLHPIPSSIPHSQSRPLSLSAPHSSSRRAPQPKTETRPLSDASRTHLLSSSCSSSHGASASALKDGDWLCSKCHFLNFASRTTCWRCAHAPSPAQRAPIRTSRVEPVVVGMRAATVLGKPVVVVFVDMPLGLAAADQGAAGVTAEAEWAATSVCSHHTAANQSDANADYKDHLHLATETQTPIANLTDDLFQALKLSPSPIALSLEHAHSTASLPLLTGDWICPSCSVVNYAFRDNCFKCDHDALDAAAPGRRLVILPRAMMTTDQQHQPLDTKSVLVALAKVQGLWQGSLAEGKSRVGPLWACTNCLYVNRWGAASCRKCGHDRDGWSRAVHRSGVGGEQVPLPVVQLPGYVWVDRGGEKQDQEQQVEQGQEEEQEEYGEDEGQELVPKVDLTGRDKARDKAAVARASRGWRRSEGKGRDGDQDEWDCD